jgi:hypothetical protein
VSAADDERAADVLVGSNGPGTAEDAAADSAWVEAAGARGEGDDTQVSPGAWGPTEVFRSARRGADTECDVAATKFTNWAELSRAELEELHTVRVLV